MSSLANLPKHIPRKSTEHVQRTKVGKIELNFLILAQPRAIMSIIFLVLPDNLLNSRNFPYPVYAFIFESVKWIVFILLISLDTQICLFNLN